MPKVTTLASQSSNKENIVPLKKPTRKAKTSARDDDDHDEVIRLGDVKRSKSINTTSKSQARSGSKSSREAIDSDPRQHASSSGDSAYVRRKKEAEINEEEEDEVHERKSKRERMLEERLALVSRFIHSKMRNVC